MEWSHDAVGKLLAVAPNGDIVVDDQASALTVYDSSGAMRWSAPQSQDLALSVAPDGAIWVADNLSRNLLGWTSDGISLPAITLNFGDGDVGLSTDAVGFVIDRADDELDPGDLGRYKWDGTLLFAGEGEKSCCFFLDAPNAIASDGHVWWAFPAGYNPPNNGYQLRSYDAARAPGVELTRGSSFQRRAVPGSFSSTTSARSRTAAVCSSVTTLRILRTSSAATALMAASFRSSRHEKSPVAPGGPWQLALCSTRAPLPPASTARSWR
jgi:hypothetical protein